jgi:hypothetical protein
VTGRRSPPSRRARRGEARRRNPDRALRLAAPLNPLAEAFHLQGDELRPLTVRVSASSAKSRPVLAEATLDLPQGWRPLWFQENLLAYFQGGGTRAVIVWPRREGKDLVMLLNSACQSQARLATYWHCLPTYAQAKRIVWDGFTMDPENPVRMVDAAFPKAMVTGENQTELSLELVGGSRRTCLGRR